MDVVCVTPLDKEAILVAHDSIVQIVDMQGQATKMRSMKSSSPIKFSFRIEAVGNVRLECIGLGSLTDYIFGQFACLTVFWPSTDMGCKAVRSVTVLSRKR